jgi:hypothetical protein
VATGYLRKYTSGSLRTPYRLASCQANFLDKRGAFLLDLLTKLQSYEQVILSDDIRQKFLTISTATVGRLLKNKRSS